MWNVCRYFDDHYEGVVSTHKTEADANAAKHKLKTGVYVSYEVRFEPPIKNN